MKILALDWGQRRIGAAVAELPAALPFPREFFVNDDSALDRIRSFCGREGIDKIILGLPRKLDGTEAASAEKVRQFAQKITRRTDLPVELIDERFTSTLANKNLDQSGLARQKIQKYRKSEVDSLAALSVLQTYLRLNS